MTNGRTVNKFTRAYVDGYDLSGYARTVGPLSCTFQEGSDDPLNAAIIGTWLGQATITPSSISAMFDNTATTGIHALMSGAGVERDVMVPIGIQAAPAQGDPVFVGQFRQSDYITEPGATPSALTIKFSPSSGSSTSLAYSQPWGVLLHAHGAETTDNIAIGVDLANIGMGTSDTTTDGGYMMYQVFAGAGAGGTANIKVQEASTNEDADFTDLLTTGLIDVGTAPVSGVVPLATTASVKQFVRWQVAFGTATTVTLALAFIRGKPR